jgi:calcium-translocating P-type ATPase
VADVLRALNTSETGLTGEEAARRHEAERPASQRNGILSAVLDQIRSPLTGILAAGATLSVILGSVADVVMIGATIAANILVGAWQERQAGQAVATLERIGTSTATVLRDGQPVTVPAPEVVPGDVLVLAPGDRVAADARLIAAQGLEVDEASLTGESLPVPKSVTGGIDAGHVVLAGSDVTVGTGQAVVVAVGRRTRMGATAAALALDEMRTSPLGIRLNRMLRQVLPVAAAGGLVVLVSGWLRGRQLLSQLAIGASIAIAAVPEGLPLLAGAGEAAVARRLAGRQALVRRLAAVEALGRVDVACTDKTGTLTEGRLALRVVADMDEEASPGNDLAPNLRQVLVTAGLATPHPDAADAAAHPTDVAVAEGVRIAGFGGELEVGREAELPFDPARSFHAALVQGRLRLKGAEEALVPRCDRVRRNGKDLPLDEAGREELLARAHQLAERGLRVLMVAEGGLETSIDDPQGLVALGFIGIADPLRAGVQAAVHRCHEAGVRVIMLTGDHPATARAIAREAGILGKRSTGGDELLTGAEIEQLQNGELDERLDRATVIARVTPLDKLRIVESLQRSGHTIAMTGDGVNDAPALRLADVGVAMGRGGTEVARQAADVVLADDNFSTLVEALVEGRGFWRNIRRALALLLGGNLGELGLVAGASALGLASPLLTRQILAVNLVTDVLPSLAVALQPPEDRNLAGLAREGTAALDAPLRRDVRRRGTGTALPALAAYIAALRSSGLAEARSVAFASIVTTQLAQTLDVGRAEGTLTRSVFGAVAGSAAVLVATLTLPPLQGFLALATPGPFGWALIGAASLAAILVGRGLSTVGAPTPRLRLLPSPAPVS